MTQVIRNIIFDWSGTLVDDLPAVWQATNHVLVMAGLAELTLDQFRSEFSLPFKGFYDRHLPHVKIEQLETWFHARFKTVQDSIVPLPHAREFLEFCRNRDLRCFVLSAVHRDHFAVQETTVGFTAFIKQAYLGVWDKRAKIHEILSDHKLHPGETLFVGDMQHDIETAKHGGVHSCAVLTGYNSAAQLRASEPDLIVEHLGELRQILERTNLEICGSAPAEHPVVTVGALIFNSSRQVLMIRTHKWSNLWGIPGGKIRYGESSIDALHREVKEETNLDISNIRFVLAQDCLHSKEFYRDAHFVLLNYTCDCTGPEDVRLNEEANDYCWATPEAALKMDLNTPTRILLEAVLGKVAP
ncbi:MAG TPA: NUDIX domain-containing protein [Candidatus Binatia bacterium]|nr:NUDIX domain-containing protein [Candidatus Binatia bacterium]